MTAKIVSILLALLTLISGTAAASFDPETDLQTQHGYILEMLDDGSFLPSRFTSVSTWWWIMTAS